ncbi:MAG: RNase H family protein [Shewanella sp.]
MTTPGTGAGIHGYLFNNDTLQEGAVYRCGDLPEGITSRGYRKITKDMKLPELPEDVDFVNCVFPLPAHLWADVAELSAFIAVFEETSPFIARNYYLFIDASYVVNAVNQWIGNWKRNNWRRADGTPIANIEEIKKIDEILIRLKKEGRGVTVSKIKGHDGHYGNEMADKLAGQASAMVAFNENPVFGPIWNASAITTVVENQTFGESVDVIQVPQITVARYVYPMVNEEHPTVTVNGETWKYMFAGNHTKNKDDIVFLCKMVPDCQFAVLFDREGWDNIYGIVNQHAVHAWGEVPAMKRYDPVGIINIEFLRRKKFVAACADGLPIAELEFSEDRNVWKFGDLAISRLLRPALLSYRSLEIRDELATWLRDSIECKPNVTKNDITDLLFDAKGKLHKDFYGQTTLAMTFDVDYPEGKKKIPVIISRGIDIPMRTDMGRVHEAGGRWYIVTRRPAERHVEYAVVYEGVKHHGLWCGYYSNKRILRDDDL